MVPWAQRKERGVGRNEASVSGRVGRVPKPRVCARPRRFCGTSHHKRTKRRRADVERKRTGPRVALDWGGRFPLTGLLNPAGRVVRGGVTGAPGGCFVKTGGGQVERTDGWAPAGVQAGEPCKGDGSAA